MSDRDLGFDDDPPDGAGGGFVFVPDPIVSSPDLLGTLAGALHHPSPVVSVAMVLVHQDGTMVEGFAGEERVALHFGVCSLAARLLEGRP